MPRHTDRRTVLKATGGLIAGGTAFAGTGTAQEDGLQLTIQETTLNPEKDGVIPVKVTFPHDTYFPQDTSFPHDTFLGVESEFVKDGEYLGTPEIPEIPEEEASLANPVRVMDFRNPHEHGKLMHFSPSDIFFPQETYDEGEETMALGVFPNEAEAIPGTNWDTDTVRVPGAGGLNGLG